MYQPYCVSLDHHARLLRTIMTDAREIMPHDMPLTVPISGSDGLEGTDPLDPSLMLMDLATTLAEHWFAML